MRYFIRFFYLGHMLVWGWALATGYQYYSVIASWEEELSPWITAFSLVALILPLLGFSLAMGGLFYRKKILLHLSSLVSFITLLLFFFNQLHCIAIALNFTLLSAWAFERQGKEAFPLHWAKFFTLACFFMIILRLGLSVYSMLQYFLYPEIFSGLGSTVFTKLTPLLFSCLLLLGGLGSLAALRGKKNYFFVCGFIILCAGVWDLYYGRMLFIPFIETLSKGRVLDRPYDAESFSHFVVTAYLLIRVGIFIATPFVNYYVLERSREIHLK